MKTVIAKAKNESGGIFTALLMAVALTATIGVGAFQVLSGPLSTMVRVKNQTLAETDMFAAAKIVMLDAVNLAGNGDCDADTFIEPVAWLSPGGPTGGGLLPLTIGANVTDPWGSQLGYCVWDIGPLADDALCGGPGAKRLDGTDNPVAGNEDTQTVVAIISSGPDRIFQSSCADYVDATTSVVTAGGDDLIKKYTYLNAAEVAGGLWTLKSGDPGTATIAKDLEVGADISFDSSAGLINTLAINSTGKVIAGGGAQLGDETDVPTCDINNVGLLRYNVADATVEVCDGAAWAASGSGGSSTPDVTSGLVGWWKLDEAAGTTAADASGSGNPGTLTNGPTWQSTGGKIDGALSFDEVNDYVGVASSASLNVTRITMAGWGYKTVANTANWSNMITRQYTGGGDLWEDVYALATDSSASDYYSCGIRTASGAAQALSTVSSNIDINSWVHLACTYDGATVALYRNGARIASAAQTGDVISETTRHVIGGGDNDGSGVPIELWAGKLDDVRLYNRALTSEEIQSVYMAGGYMAGGGILLSGWTDDGTVVRLSTPTDRVGIGTSSPDNLFGINGALVVWGDNGDSQASDLVLGSASSSTIWSKADVDFVRARGTISVPTVVAADDFLGTLRFRGYDSNSWETAAEIIARVPSGTTPVDTNMPGEIVFSTRPNGAAATSTERMILTSDGRLTSSYNSGTLGIYDVKNASIYLNSPNPGLGIKDTGATHGWLMEAGSDSSLGFRRGNDSGSMDSDFLMRFSGTGTEIWLAPSGGEVGIGTIDPRNMLDIRGALPGISIFDTDAAISSSNPAFRMRVHDNMGSGLAGLVFQTTTDYSSYSNGIVVRADGNVGIGVSNPTNKVDIAGDVELGIFINIASDTAGWNPYFMTRRSRGTVSAPTAVQSGDALYDHTIMAYDGSTSRHAALIQAVVDGTPGANDMPTRLEFQVQADGAGGWMGDGSSTPEMVIKSNGNVGLSTSSPQSTLHVPDGKYAQFEDNNAGAPAAGDCDANTERGRMSIDTTNNRLYICNGATRGWDYVALTD